MPADFEQASVQYNDFKGTAAADDADIQKDDLYGLFGIDEKGWWIVAIELYGGYEISGGSVLAMSKSGDWGHDEVERLTNDGKPIPTTRFYINEGNDNGVGALRRLKRWAVNLESRTLSSLGARIEVVDERTM